MVEDAGDDVVGGKAVGLGFIADDDAMAQASAARVLTSCGVT